MGITVGLGFYEPMDIYDPEDLLASERGLAFGGGWFINPIYKNGDYPENMKEQIAMKCKIQGYKKSRLPEFTEEEKRRINGIVFTEHLDFMWTYVFL